MLPEIGIKFITQLYNAVTQKAQGLLPNKSVDNCDPGKVAEPAESYGPISLLPKNYLRNFYFQDSP